MKILRKDLLTALDKTAPLCGKRTTLPVLNHLLISSDGSRLTITATDLDCHAKASCACNGVLEPVCVPASAFTGLAKVSRDDIELTVANNRLKFSSNGNASLASLPVGEFPEWPKNTQFKSIGVSCEDMAHCIESVAWSAAKDDLSVTNMVYCSTWVKCEPKRMIACATNGKQFAHIDKPLISAECEFLIPGNSCARFVEALKYKDAVFRLSDKFAAVESPELTLCAKLMEGTYVNIAPLLNQKCDGPFALPVQEVLEAINNAMMVCYSSAANPFPSATLTPQDGKALFVYDSSDNTYETVLDIKLPRSIRFGLQLMKESLIQVVSDAPKAFLGNQLLVKDGDTTIAVALLVDKTA